MQPRQKRNSSSPRLCLSPLSPNPEPATQLELSPFSLVGALGLAAQPAAATAFSSSGCTPSIEESPYLQGQTRPDNAAVTETQLLVAAPLPFTIKPKPEPAT
jgi:hypothetical protein